MWSTKLLVLAFVPVAFSASGPVEFGLSEFQAASSTLKWPVKVKTELSVDPPETFRIEVYTSGGGRVTGGDLRGLMYGLIEASEQIRSLGHLKATHGVSATPLRAVRFTLAPGEIDQPWFSSDQFWRGYFQSLARSRINRFALAVPRLPDPPNRLRGLSQLAAYYGVDFVLGLPEPSGDPLLLRARLVAILTACPQIRGIEMDAATAPIDLLHDQVLSAIETAGRRVTLDLRNASARRDLNPILDRAAAAGLALRISSPSACKELADLPEGSCYWALREPASADAESIRARAADLSADGSVGFEIEAPRSDGAPESTSQVEHPSFYSAWGRISYDPKPPAPAPAPAANGGIRPAPPKPAPAATPNRRQ